MGRGGSGVGLPPLAGVPLPAQAELPWPLPWLLGADLLPPRHPCPESSERIPLILLSLPVLSDLRTVVGSVVPAELRELVLLAMEAQRKGDDVPVLVSVTPSLLRCHLLF